MPSSALLVFLPTKWGVARSGAVYSAFAGGVMSADRDAAHDPSVAYDAIPPQRGGRAEEEGKTSTYRAATARLAAEVTALSEAVTMLESMPTPHSTRPAWVSASMKLTACASEPAPVACWW